MDSKHSLTVNQTALAMAPNENTANPETPQIVGVTAEQITVLRDFYSNVTYNLIQPSTCPKEIITTFKMIEAPTPFFTGRQELIQKIHAQLVSCSHKTEYYERIVVLHGLGGMGKSQLARKYVETHIHHPIIQNVAWINAEDKSSIKSSLRKLAAKLNLAEAENVYFEDAQDLAEKFYQHFSQHVGTGLIIFDNVEQLRGHEMKFGIREFLPDQGQDLERLPLILITSRSSEWEIPRDAKNIIRVEELGEEDSVQFLTVKLRLTSDQQEDAGIMSKVKLLASTIQGFPLGLTLAASNIIVEDWLDIGSQIDEYISKLNTPNSGWIDNEFSSGESTKYKLVMRNVWKTTFEKIKCMGSEGECALNLLNIMAYLPTDKISKEETENIFKFLFPAMSKMINAGFSILARYSLISIQTKEQIQIQIHRHVQRCSREALDFYKNYEILFGLARYLNRCGNSSLEEERILVHFYLKQRKWPENSFYLSVLLISQLPQSCPSQRARLNTIFLEWDDYIKKSDPHSLEILADGYKILMQVVGYFFVKSGEEWFEVKIEKEDEKFEPAFKSTGEFYFSNCLLVNETLTFQNEQESGSSEVNAEAYICHFWHGIMETVKRNRISEALKEEIGKVLLSTVNSITAGPCNLKYVGKIYKYLATYYLDSGRDDSSRALFLQAAIKKHFEVYDCSVSQENGSFNESLRDYWKSGPIDYTELALQFLGGTVASSTKEMLLQEFLSHRGPLLLVHNLEVCMIGSNVKECNSNQLLDFIMSLKYNCDAVEKLAQTPDFLKCVYTLVENAFCLDPHSHQIFQLQSLVAWFGFFTNTSSISDPRGVKWSIISLAEQIAMYVSYTASIEKERRDVFSYALHSPIVRDSLKEIASEENSHVDELTREAATKMIKQIEILAALTMEPLVEGFINFGVGVAKVFSECRVA